jgi:hypothetical protein
MTKTLILGLALTAAGRVKAGQLVSFTSEEAREAAGDWIDANPAAISFAQTENAEVIAWPVLTEDEQAEAAAKVQADSAKSGKA